MINKLLKIEEIMELLGYTDTRSVETWCREHKIPLLKLGMNYYTISNFMDVFLEKEIEKFVLNNFDEPDKIMASMRNDDKADLSERLSAPIEGRVKRSYKEKVKRTKETEDFINNLKAS
jgi:hypothetical protein